MWRKLMCTVALCGGSSAAADPARETSEPDVATAPRLVVSLPLMALSSDALAVQLDRPLTHRKSLAVSAGVRDGADGSYSSQTVGLGLELRFWLRAAQRGLFVALRLDGAITHMAMESPARSLGTGLALTQAGLVGYRFTLSRIELTPTLGVGLREDLPHGAVPGALRSTAVMGLSAGVMF